MTMGFLAACGGGGGGGDDTPPPPSAPTLVSATSGDAKVTITWAASVGATSYNLYWSNTAGVTKTTGTKIAGVTAPFEHTSLTNGTAYYYVVTAVGPGGESADSDEVSAVPQVPVPGAPQNLSAALTRGGGGEPSVSVSWSPPLAAGTYTYNLYRSTAAGIVPASCPSTACTKFPNVISPFIDVAPGESVTFYYVVTAVASNVEGPPSTEVSVKRGSSSGTGGGGGETGAYGNNLSVPVVFADGVGILGGTITGTDYKDLATGLRPTATDVTTPFPYFNLADIYTLLGVDYYRQQTSSTWQASWINGKTSAQNVEVDWGDNLASASLSSSQTIRVETVLRQYPGEDQSQPTSTSWGFVDPVAYPMTLLYGQGSTEMQGTTGTTTTPTEARVFAVTARLKIQKLEDDGIGGLVAVDHPCGTPPNGVSIAQGLAATDGRTTVKYGAEINVGGSLTYGFNWRLNQCGSTDKAGAWRMTFSLDPSATVGSTTYTNNTFMKRLHPSEATSTLVNTATTYIDVTVN